MTYKTKTRLPLSSFDPRFRELLLRGAEREFTLTCETVREARAMRARIHTYRSQAKAHYGEAAREQWEPLYLCSIYLIKAPAPQLRFAPRHGEFDKVLSQVPEATPAPIPPSTAVDLLEKLELEQKAHEGKS